MLCLYISPAHPSLQFSSVQFSRSVQLCDPMDCSTPGFPVHHQLLEFTHTHVHWVGDAAQLSHPRSSPFPPTFNFSQHLGLFKWVSSSNQPKSWWPLIFHISTVCLFQNVLWSELNRMHTLDYLSFSNMHVRFHGLIAHLFLLLNNIPL